ncbi:Rieske 2Fe-2S domain-containing protein [Mesorhizobium sp. M0091]|uniref:Rieske 2Fe-2S domain-containing protein n=1 Tax=Mesorhizobium sp. M0091 TaxID=2956875 RepID=UPI0033359431
MIRPSTRPSASMSSQPAGWASVFASDIPNPDDVVPVSVAGYELILVRLKDGAIKCYHNVCRHRGMKLVKEKGNVSALLTFSEPALLTRA